jgi:hypothetical protein
MHTKVWSSQLLRAKYSYDNNEMGVMEIVCGVVDSSSSG